MANDVDDLKTLVTDVRTAIQISDWDTAESKLLEARAVLSSIPDATRDGVSLRWEREQLQTLQNEISGKRTVAGTSTGIKRTKLKYVRST